MLTHELWRTRWLDTLMVLLTVIVSIGVIVPRVSANCNCLGKNYCKCTTGECNTEVLAWYCICKGGERCKQCPQWFVCENHPGGDPPCPNPLGSDKCTVLNSSGGGVIVPVDKFGLVAPYIGLASTILATTVATAIYAKRAKRRNEKQ